MRLSRIAACLGLAVTFGAASATAWTASSSAASERPHAASAAATLSIYLAPSNKGGSDKHTGLSRKSPILTLTRAQQVLEQQKPKVNVIVRIDQGTYVAPQTKWTFYVPGHTISFMPINYVVGHGRPAGGDPVFLNPGSGNDHPGGWWFQAQLPSAKSNPLYNGGTMGLRFYYLRISYYTQGISLDGQTGHASVKNGMYIKPSNGFNGNYVSGMTIYDVGDAYTDGDSNQTGFGAILLTDSSDNTITNNTFQNIENNAATNTKIHGIYVTHFSSNNSITRNEFNTSSGEAVKVRDRSNYNTVDYNRFDYINGYSAYLDEFCDGACVKANPGTPRQCASYGNVFAFNSVLNTARTVYLDPPGEKYAGGSGCSIPKGQERLRYYNN